MAHARATLVAAGTPALEEGERREFSRRFAELRRRAAETLEAGWVSQVEAAPALVHRHG